MRRRQISLAGERDAVSFLESPFCQLEASFTTAEGVRVEAKEVHLADTFTSALRLCKPEVGADEDTWGGVLNAQTIDLIDEAVGGYSSISVASGNVTLTANNGATDQSRCAVIKLTGSPGTTRTVTAPDVKKTYWVINAVGDSSSVTFTAGAGTTVSIPAGCTAKIYTDGATNAVRLFLYGEGTWTPVLTCATPGNLAVTYNFQTGKWSRIGNRVSLDILMTTTSFTWSTASGNVSITGLPFTPVSNAVGAGALDWGGITKAGYTQVGFEALITPELRLVAAGSGVTSAIITISDLPSGGTIILRGSISYMT